MQQEWIAENALNICICNGSLYTNGSMEPIDTQESRSRFYYNFKD